MDKNVSISQRVRNMLKELTAAGLDNDKTMKRPIETVKESRPISSCTPSPVTPLP